MINGSDLAVVFPGQGAQRPGMGRDFFEAFIEARQVFEEASDTLALDLRRLCFEDDERLGLTLYTQPALVTVEIAMFRVLNSQFGIAPRFFGGHSLGEYSALCAASAIPLSTCVSLVAERGRLMQAAVPPGMGAMLAVIGPDALQQITPELAASWQVDLANLNSPDQVVLSGLREAIRLVPEDLRGRFDTPYETVLLEVSAPFHSRHMRAISAEFRPRLEQLLPVLAPDRAANVTSNTSGRFHQPQGARVIDALALQATTAVRWVENMKAISCVASRVLEVGPGRPLGRFFRAAGLSATSITSVRTAASFQPDRPPAVEQIR